MKLLIPLALLAGAFSCSFPDALRGDNPTALNTGDPDVVYELKTPYHTEEQWIVSSICRNAYELLSFVSDKKGEIIAPDAVTVKKIDGAATAYEVTLRAAKGTVDVTLHFPGAIWSSQAYVPFCQAAMAQLKIAPASTGKTAKGTPLATLLDFSERAIESENHRVSQWLTEEPDNPLAHQQAALVLGTLAMKENSGWFWDPRDICNHIIAHLAVAGSLGGGAGQSIEGQLGECMVGLIDDTKKDCGDELDRLGKITDPPKELAEWINASRMRNSRDWRILDKPETASGIEQVEYFRALGEAVSCTQAVATLNEKSFPKRQDWTRITLEGGCSVENGHVYAMPSVSTEIATMRALFPDRFQKNTLVNDLNEAPGDVLGIDASGNASLRVISSGMWAQFFQRHLCHAIYETGYFLQCMWGVPDQAAQFDTAVSHAFSGLNLYPYVQEVNALRRKKTDDPKAIMASFVTHPEWASDWISQMPHESSIDPHRFHAAVFGWFSPAMPTGTAYSAFNRLYNVGGGLKFQPGTIDKLYAIAPLQFRVAELELTTRYTEHPTYSQVQEVMGPMVDYYLDALDWAANAKDVQLDPRISLEERAASMDPGRFWQLADDLRKNGRDSDAADAFQHYYDKGADRVGVSVRMDWLVNYYFDHGQPDKAMAIAKDGAEVYSAGGLETMMHLLTRMGKLSEAEEYGQKIKERYGGSGPLIVFYKTETDAGVDGYQDKLNAALQNTFPGGLKKVTLQSFSAAPTAGMQFDETSPSMQENGLSSSQVVVALDGYQVDNQAQYTTVRSFSTAPAMDFIVWDGSAYREIKATRPGRRFDVQIHDYSR